MKTSIYFFLHIFCLLLGHWAYSQCTGNLEINDVPVEEGYYSDCGITSNGNVWDQSNILFKAESHIELLPGFEAEAGSVFEAKIWKEEKLNTVSFQDSDYPEVEGAYTYNFALPVNPENDPLNILTADPATYVPDMDNRYFISVFGPRYKDNNASNELNFDSHQGSDIVYGTVPSTPDEDIFCMCDGVIAATKDEDTGEEGRWVNVKCNASFNVNAGWENIYMAYRHLDVIGNNPSTGQKWKKDDTINQEAIIGKMGSTGVTSNIHLHFSVQRKVYDEDHEYHNRGALYNVHPMRVFDPAAFPHLLEPLQDAEIYLLDYSYNAALLRIAVPHNQANLKAITVGLADGSYTKTYDFEEVSEKGDSESAIRDDYQYLDGLSIYPYPFNRGESAYERYENIKNSLPNIYPGSIQRGYAIPDEGIFSTPAYVLDLEVNDLPPSFRIEDLQASLIDIWGNGVKTQGNHPPLAKITYAKGNAYLADDHNFFELNETINFEGELNDLEGAISKMRILIDGNLDQEFTNPLSPYSFTISSTNLSAGSHTVQVEAEDQNGVSSKSNSLNLHLTGNQVFKAKITENEDDAEEFVSSGEIETFTNGTEGSYDLDLCQDSNGSQLVGIRFPVTTIPKDAVIHQAYVQFSAVSGDCGETSLQIFGEASDNASSFSNEDNNISNRTTTSNSITSWQPGCWKAGESGLDQRTPDLAPIVQEIVNRGGWASGNSLAFIFESADTETRHAYAQKGTKPYGEKSPALIVEYSDPLSSRPLPGIPGHTTTDVTQPSLTLYPNPTPGSFINLQFQGLETTGTVNINLYNSLGQLQKQQVLYLEDGPQHQMNLSGLSAGLYLLRAEVDGQVLTRQLVVQ